MSEIIDRTIQNSSMIFAVCGKSSLTSMPFLPYFWKRNGDFIRLPVANSVRGVSYGSGLPSYFSSIGL